jgi:hypothetical protein
MPRMVYASALHESFIIHFGKNEYNCYGYILLILGKIKKYILGYAQSPSSSINQHLKATLFKATGQYQHVNQVIDKAQDRAPSHEEEEPVSQNTAQRVEMVYTHYYI